MVHEILQISSFRWLQIWWLQMTSWQKVKVTSCILPQRNSNSVQKLIRYSFKGVLLIHEELPYLWIYIAFLVRSLKQVNNTSHEVSIFCSTRFYHLLVLANFSCEIKQINKYNNKLKNFSPWIHYDDHIELHLEFQHWRKFLGDDVLFLMILLTAVALKRYIERIYPLHLRYRNTFCCYTLLMDVFPLSPNQFDTHPWDSLQ